LDGLAVDAAIKLDIVQIEKMIPLMLDAPTPTNPRQRIQIESPQVACFKLDEMIRWPKNKILLLDLGTIPLPALSDQAETQNFFSGIAKNISPSSRANVLLFIECVSGKVTVLPTSPQPVSTSNRSSSILSSDSPFWQGIR
jgi:hypothetical protein